MIRSEAQTRWGCEWNACTRSAKTVFTWSTTSTSYEFPFDFWNPLKIAPWSSPWPVFTPTCLLCSRNGTSVSLGTGITDDLDDQSKLWRKKNNLRFSSTSATFEFHAETNRGRRFLCGGIQGKSLVYTISMDKPCTASVKTKTNFKILQWTRRSRSTRRRRCAECA